MPSSKRIGPEFLRVNLLPKEREAREGGQEVSIQDTTNGGRDSLSSPRCITLQSGEIGMATDPGGRDGKNQDAVGLNKEGVIVVADGMGGHDAGDVAALVAVEKVTKNIKEGISVVPAEEDNEAYGLYFDLKTRISHQIDGLRYSDKPFARERSEKLEELKKDLEQNKDRWVMLSDLKDIYSEFVTKNVGDGGAAMTFGFLDRGGVFQVFQMGDTVFHIHHADGAHEEIFTHGFGRFLSHGLSSRRGEIDNVLARWYSFPLKEGDVVVMCSDGVRDDRNITADELSRIVEEQKKPDSIIKKIGEETENRMNSGGGKKDNRAVVVFVYNGEVNSASPEITLYEKPEISIVDSRHTGTSDTDPDITPPEPIRRR